MANPFNEPDDPFEEPDAAALFAIGTTRVVRGVGDGIRIYHICINGEVRRTIEETNLVPSLNPFQFSNIFILPNPTVDYRTRPHDWEASSDKFDSTLRVIDLHHGIQSAAAFAAHPNGTNPLTPQILPIELFHGDEHQFTLWYTLKLANGTTKIIKRNP